MAKSIKLKEDTYIDSTSVVHQKQKLSDIFNYGNHEQIIGTWVSGATLYRQYFLTRSPSAVNTEEAIATLPSNQETMVRMYGQVYVVAYKAIVPIPYAFNTGNMGGIYFNPVTKKVMMSVTNAGYCNQEVALVIEYTKR